MKIKVFFTTVIILISVFFLLSVQKEKVAEIQMTTIEGNNISTNNLLGKVYLINFWATDCPGCIKEMPDLIKTYNKYKDNNFEILAISMHYDPPSRVMSYAQKNSLPFPVIMDIKKDIIKHFKKVKLTPTSILVNHEGKIVNTIIGEIEFKEFNQTVEALLKKANQHSL
ncbi:MAG: TlpA disulfide reductase family protein [Proteobacteria bacterium]|jgi:peroxiredoxin|nr:TlpA disulfide reductase family protein [Pseudomonadota bacterium]